MGIINSFYFKSNKVYIIVLSLIFFCAGAGVENPYLNLAGNFSIFDLFVIFILPQNFKILKESLLMLILSFSLLLLSSLSILYNLNHYSFENIIENPFFYSIRFGFYSLMILVISKKNILNKERFLLLRMFLFGIVFTILHSWIVWFTTPIYGWGKIPYLTSEIYNPNTLVFYSLIYLSLDLFILELTNKLNKYLRFLFRFIMIFTILFCLSKAGWLILVLLLLVKLFHSSFKLVLSICALSVFLYVSFLNYFPIGEIKSDLIDTFEGRFAGSENSNEQRSSMFITGINMMVDNPILGIGPKNYREFTKNYDGFASRDPHNVFSWIGAELGIFAFLTLVSIFLIFTFYSIAYQFNWKKYFINWIPFFTVLLLQSFVSGLPISDKAIWYVLPLLFGINNSYFLNKNEFNKSNSFITH